MCMEKCNGETNEKPFVSSLLKLPLFQEMDDGTQNQDDDQSDILSVQRALIDYFLNLPAFRELEEHQENSEE